VTPPSASPALLTGDVDALPDVALISDASASAAFRARGVQDLRAAARHVRDLPYGRITDRARPGLVLEEGRGTCTTKHALLAEVAAAQGVDLALVLGIYEMSEANTPGVGTVLARHGLTAIPEAHCYVGWKGQRIDVTRAVTAVEPITSFLHEERIDPVQIGAYKIEMHRRFIAGWVARCRPALNLEDAWRIREACIAALSDPR
jgi:hypothetical protein